MSWDQIVALTHKEDVMLRPTLSDDMDAATADLVQMCWAHDPAARPSCTVILVRLERIARGREEGKKFKIETTLEALKAKNINMNRGANEPEHHWKARVMKVGTQNCYSLVTGVTLVPSP